MVARREAIQFDEKEYLALEGVADFKHEYTRGYIVGMAGAEFAHNVIAVNVAFEMRQAIGNGPCQVVNSDQRVKVEATREYYYPDVTVVCAEPKLAAPKPQSLTNPSIIVEVQSPSTAAYDAGEKLESYRQIQSLDDYLLVASERRQVTHYYRSGANDWGVRTYVAGEVRLTNGLMLDLDRIYRRVEGL